MVIRNRNGNDIRPSEITPRGIYLNRRELMGKAAGLGALAREPSFFGSASRDARFREEQILDERTGDGTRICDKLQ
jgi:hypothetical protein